MARRKGVVKKWFDDKGFGFVVPEGSDENVFVHWRDVSGGRPVGNEELEFEVAVDPKNQKPRVVDARIISSPHAAGNGSAAPPPAPPAPHAAHPSGYPYPHPPPGGRPPYPPAPYGMYPPYPCAPPPMDYYAAWGYPPGFPYPPPPPHPYPHAAPPPRPPAKF
eukprot:TRINITY_DN6420_c0_g1_i1.p1 TRINITY_DN6420_c0_g1~~TRINITY_DN6420_c0_g1_i1.p1  ORF type:complete len:163 (+),score=44.11 TRINITY_DN6420_c0_g1_i1:125-613(+)